MQEKRSSMHGLWSSSWAFVLAATAAAVGLGNIWKFPYITGQNGGGAFVVVYIICTLLMGIPLMIAEIMIGRTGRQNPANSVATLAEEDGVSRRWGLVGGLTVISGPLILSYYSVIAGWAMAYVFKSGSGIFTHLTGPQAKQLFDDFVSNPYKLAFWHTMLILGSSLVITRGIEKGIEKAVNIMFPALVALLLILVGYGIKSSHFSETLVYLFEPDFTKLTPHVILVAMGQAFFSLSIATGTIMMYGAYLPRNASIVSAAVSISMADMGIALLSGLAIFPVVFANNLEPSAGPGLIFQTLPLAFGKMPMGNLFAVIFFVMLVFAAFTSAISLLEPATAWCIERRGLTRNQATLLVSFLVWLLGFGTIFSFNSFSNVKLFGLNFFEGLDYLTANLMLPIGGFFIAIFTVWRLSKHTTLQGLQMADSGLYHCWRFTLRYISPILILLVFLKFIGVF